MNKVQPRTRSFWIAGVTFAALAMLSATAQPGSDAAKPVAMIDHAAVTWQDIGPLLAEAAGAEVLDEVVLANAAAKRAHEEGITLTPAMVESERAMFVSSLAATGLTTDADRAERLLAEVRRSRGLGPKRFQSLLERSALLRALVRKAGEVSVTDDDVRQAYRIKFGPQRKIRLIVVPTQRDAQDALERVRASNDHPAELFADVAVDVSTDPSRTRGGLIGWVRTDDPAYPRALLTTINSLAADTVAGPIALESGYAIVRVEEILEQPQPSPASVHDALRAEVVAVRERAAMERLARTLLEDARSRVTVFERSLGDAWDRR